jgi:hypothetical protein
VRLLQERIEELESRVAQLTDPPTECISEANTFNDLNSHAGGIVRAGEYWTLTGTHTGKKSFGYECVFTPLW